MATPDNSPHLKRVLYSYKSQAMNTLQGPGMNHHIMEHLRKDADLVDGGLKGYNFKKAFIYNSFHRVREESCKKCEDVEIATVPKCSPPDAAAAAAVISSSWHTTITPCVDKCHRSPPSAAAAAVVTATAVVVDKSRGPKDETKIVLIKNEPPIKKAASGEDSSRSRGGGKWIEQQQLRGDIYLAPPFPPKPLPVLASADPGVLPPLHGRSDTFLEGEAIACFYIGGEPRLCLPQILNTILRKFSLTQINAFCDELQIFCSRCTPRQLDFLKDTGVLPSSATSCGLITKTDAQRLTHALFFSVRLRAANNNAPPPAPPHLSLDKHPHIRVSHNCFGKCKALVWTDLYATASEPCVQCLECGHLLTPMQFVCHAHKNLENRTCHWGFDADNWRSYLMLAKDQDQPLNKAEEELRAFKDKFDSVNHKRKQALDAKDNTAKKVRSDDLYPNYDPNFLTSFMTWGPYGNGIAPPWTVVPLMTKDGKQLPPVFVKDSMPSLIPDYLSQEPPVLLDPARVVPLSESEKFERNFQPNVALAPLKARHKCVVKDSLTIELKGEELRTKSPTKQVNYEKLSPVGNKEVSYLKIETEPLGSATMALKSDTKESLNDEVIVLKLDKDSIPKCHGALELNLPPDLELSTTDSDNESLNSVTSKSEVVEETEALLRGWTTDRAAAKKVLEIVDSLAKSSLEKDKKLDEVSKENARLMYALQMYEKEQEARQKKTVSDGEQMNEKYSTTESCFQVKKEP